MTTVTETQLTDDDKESLKGSIKLYLIFSLLFFLIALVVLLGGGVIFSLFSDMEVGWEGRFMFTFSILFVLSFVVAAQPAIPCYRDLKTGKKLCITSDSFEIVVKKHDKFIRFSNTTQKDIEISSQNAELLSIEHPVFIEIAPRSKDIFSLVQNGKDLMDEEEDKSRA